MYVDWMPGLLAVGRFGASLLHAKVVFQACFPYDEDTSAIMFDHYRSWAH